MDIRDYVTPKTVVIFLGISLAVALLLIFSSPKSHRPTVWDGYMDLVALASLLVTLTILSDLEELQDRYLLRATIGDLQSNLKQKAENLGELLRSGFEESERQIARELSKEDGILKRIADRTENVDSDVYQEAESLRKDIQAYNNGSEDEVYDIWRDTHTLNELLKGLIEESKWRR